MKLTPEQLAKLLAIASAKTGSSPEELLEMLQGGRLSEAAGLFGADGEMARELFASGRLEELLKNPSAADILMQLLK